MKVALVEIARRRCHGPSILALTAAFVFAAPLCARQTPVVPINTQMTGNGSLTAEPQPNVHHVREEVARGEIF